MFQVTLTSPNGNTAGHRFPITGYYGVTPVDLSGRCTFNIIDGGHPVPVRCVHLAIRCYEIREGGRQRTKRERVVWEKVRSIWQPPPGVEEVPLEDGWKTDFKLVIPPEVAEIAQGTQQLREWRVRWRLEATVEHAPIPYVGHRVAHAYDIVLHDHRSPTPSLPSPPSGQIIGSGATAAHVHINPPPTAYGPSENLAVSFSVRPEDPSVFIKSLQVVLDRRLELFDDRRPSSGGRRNRVGSLFHRGNGNNSSQSSRSSSEEGANRAIVTRIAETHCEVPEPGSTGAVWSVAQLQLPRRTHHNWDMGETERTEFADVSFEARLKVTLKSRRGGSQKELVSQPIPIVIVGTTAEERAAAQHATERIKPGSKRRLVHCRDTYTQSGSSQSELAHVIKTRRSDRESATPPAQASMCSLDTLPSPPSEDSLPPINTFLGFEGPQPAQSIRSMDFDSDTASIRTTSTIAPLPRRDPEEDYLLAPLRTARRISSTSEDEDAVPRSRQKVERSSEPPPSMFETALRRRRLPLPSLDALGLGLPKVSEEQRPMPRGRPNTAPTFGVYEAKPPPFGRPGSSAGPSSSGFSFVMPSRQQQPSVAK